MDNLLSLDAFDAALERKDWTLKKLADEYDRKYPDNNPDKSAKTIYPTLLKWHKGKSNPTLNRLIRIAELLDVDVDFLLGRMKEYTHSEKVIHQATGLSYEAIEKTLKLGSLDIQSLDLLLKDDNFELVLYYIARYQASLSVDFDQLRKNDLNEINHLISEVSGKEEHTLESGHKRTIADQAFQLAEITPDALAYQVDTKFRIVIDNIKKADKLLNG